MPAEDLSRATAEGTLRRSLRVVREGVRLEPGLFALAVGGSALYGVMTAGMAQAVGWVTTHAMQPAIREGRLTPGRAALIFAVIGGVVVLTTVGVLLRRIAGGFTMFNVAADYRRQVTRQYLRLPLAWHHRHPSGQLLSNANADVEAAWGIFMPLPMALGVVVMLLTGAVQMVLVDPVLAAVGFGIFPLLFLANAIFQRRMSARVTRAQQLRAEVAEVAHESFDGALLVKVMGREAHETERFAEVSDRLRRAAIAVGRTRGTFDPIIEAIPTFGTLALLAIGVQRVASGAVTTAELVQLAYLISVLAFPVRALGWVLGEIPRTLVGWERVSAVLEARGQMTYGETHLPGEAALGPESPSGVRVGFEAVSYDYAVASPPALAAAAPDATAGDRRGGEHRDVVEALSGVTLDVAPGQTVAVVGPTGSGKSTLAALAVRLVDPTQGRVLIDGTDVTDLARGALAREAALVPQQTFVFDDTVRGNITLGLEIPDEEVWAALRAAQADGFVCALPDALETRVGERGATLSGGQRQRLALARALVRRPRLLVLDDATSAVDPTVEQAILAELGAGAGGMTLIVIAYRMSTIALADEIVYLERGRLVDRGRHDALMARCRGYHDLVTAYAREAADRADRAARDRAGAGKRHTTGAGTGGRR
ncbi:MAG: ABC transporter ATP-binding protein [Dermatophilaceae bacterium]